MRSTLGVGPEVSDGPLVGSSGLKVLLGLPEPSFLSSRWSAMLSFLLPLDALNRDVRLIMSRLPPGLCFAPDKDEADSEPSLAELGASERFSSLRCSKKCLCLP